MGNVCTRTRTSTRARVSPVPLTVPQKPTSTDGVKMLTYIFKMSCLETKITDCSSMSKKAEKLKKGTEKLADHHKNIHKKTKIQTRRMIFIIIILLFINSFLCRTFRFPHYFQWQCNIFQSFLVQGQFSVIHTKYLRFVGLPLRTFAFPHQRFLLCPLLSGCIVSKIQNKISLCLLD